MGGTSRVSQSAGSFVVVKGSTSALTLRPAMSSRSEAGASAAVSAASSIARTRSSQIRRAVSSIRGLAGVPGSYPFRNNSRERSTVSKAFQRRASRGWST